LGGFVVEATAALSILVYLAFLWLASRWNQQSSGKEIFYSVLTGICVGAGTIAFFLLFQKGGPLSAVPAILAGGAAIMAIAGILFFTKRRRGSGSLASRSRWQGCFCCANNTEKEQAVVELRSSLRKELQPDVTHRGCVADDIASTGEEQVEMFVQLPSAADVERQLGTAAALLRGIPE
jgi:hypothetical protein